MEPTETDEQEDAWAPVAPVAGRTPRISTTHPEFGRPVSKKVFKDANGAYMASFKFRVGDAFAFDGISLWQAPDGRLAWRWAVLPRGIAPPEIDAQIDRLREAMTRNPQPAELVPCAPAARKPSVDLYANVVAIFDERSTERLSSEAICAALQEQHGTQISKNSLARQLRLRGIRPKLLKIEKRSIRGYERAAFDRAEVAPSL